MAATALVAARVEPALKDRAGAVLKRVGMTESQLIRRVFEYVAHEGDVPSFTLSDSYEIDLRSGERIGALLRFQPLIDFLNADPYDDRDFTGISDEAIETGYREAMEADLEKDSEDE